MKQKNDIKLVVALLVIGFVIMGIMQLLKQEGGEAVVTVDGEEIASYSLDKNGSYEITGVDGGKNTLVIEDGQAYMSQADCPDELCVKTGRVQYDGETIVCLPHKVVVTIQSDEKAKVKESGNSEMDIDAVAK